MRSKMSHEFLTARGKMWQRQDLLLLLPMKFTPQWAWVLSNLWYVHSPTRRHVIKNKNVIFTAKTMMWMFSYTYWASSTLNASWKDMPTRLIFSRKSTGSGIHEVGHGIRLARHTYVEMVKTRKEEWIGLWEVMVTKLSRRAIHKFGMLDCYICGFR